MKTRQAKANDSTLFAKGDPLTALLVGHLHIRPWLATLAFGLVINIPIILAASINDFWLNRGGVIGLLHDYTYWVNQLSSLPATVFVFFWMPEGVLGVLEGLRGNRVIVVSGDAFSDFVYRFDRIYSHWAWAIVSCISAIAITIATLPVRRAYKTWIPLNTFAFWYMEVFWFLAEFLVCLIVLRCVIVLWWFNRLFKECRVDVKVLHPDRAGGLYPLGDFSVKVAYVIGIYGFSLVANAWAQSYLLTGQPSSLTLNLPVVLMTVAYVVLAPAVFFAPVGAAHSAMKTAKRAFMLQIAEQFDADFTNMQFLLSADPDRLGKSLEKIEQLQKIHKMASQFPVWPFNTQSLVRFFSSILSPAVLAIMPGVITLLLS